MKELLPNKIHIHTSAVNSSIGQCCNNIISHATVWSAAPARVKAMWDFWNQIHVLSGQSRSLSAKGGGEVLGRVPDICVQYSRSPLITHNFPHTHPYTRTHISKMLECGEMCERGFLGHLSAHWDRSCPGNGAVQCESQSCWVLHLLPLMFCIYGSWSSSCFDVFSPNSSWKDRRECETQTSITGRRLNLFSEGQTKRCNRSMLFLWSYCSRFPVTKHRDPVTLGETVQTHSLHHTFTLLHHVSRG